MSKCIKTILNCNMVCKQTGFMYVGAGCWTRSILRWFCKHRRCQFLKSSNACAYTTSVTMACKCTCSA